MSPTGHFFCVKRCPCCNLRSGPILAVLIHSLQRLPLSFRLARRNVITSETKIEPDLRLPMLWRLGLCEVWYLRTGTTTRN